MKIIIFLLLFLSAALAQQCLNCRDQCIDGKVCSGCDEGFLLDNTGSCSRYTPVQGCRIYDAHTRQCFECYPGHLLQNKICQKLIKNCNQTVTNNTEVCSKCNETYVLVRNISCYSSNVENCPQGSLPRILSETQEPYCQKFQIQKCQLADQSAEYCRKCLNNAKNINGVCYNVLNETHCAGNSCKCQYYLYKDICYQFELEGCLKSNDKLFCDLCGENLVAVNGRCFTPVKLSDIHCNVLQLNSNICTGCNFQYLLDPNRICVKNFGFCANETQNCQTQCNSSNLLFYNGVCYINDPYCVTYDTRVNKCTACFEGYQLKSNNRCQKAQKCLKYFSNNRCNKCFQGFQLNSNTFNCDTLPSNCLNMSPAGRCLSCNNFTRLITQTVGSGETFPSNLSVVMNTSVCVYETANCKYYNAFGFCEICSSGYVQRNRECVALAQNCQIPLAEDKSKCSLCQLGYQLDQNSQTCFSKIQGCLSYGSNKKCTRCNENFILRNGLCFYQDINCLEWKANGNCKRCANNLVPYYNRCVYYDSYCFLYDENGVCTLPFAGFSKMTVFSGNLKSNYTSFIQHVRSFQQASSEGGSTGGNLAETSIHGGYYSGLGIIRVLPSTGLFNERILEYDVNGKIRFCRDGFTLEQDNCVNKIDFCSRYSATNGLCIVCKPFYHLDAGRICRPFSASICSIPASTSGLCSKCTKNYTLINGQCYFSGLNVLQYSISGQVSVVETGYFIYKRYQIAWPYDANCISQEQPGKCLQCLQQSEYMQRGMKRIDGKCVLFKDYCLKYNERGLCEVCSTGYYLYLGQCFVDNCLSHVQIDGNICASCPFLYQYEAGICVSRSQNTNCLVFEILNTSSMGSLRQIPCRFCDDGYYLKSDKTCERMITNCEVTDANTGRCTSCIESYVLYQEQCVKQIAGCSVYNLTTSFTTCSSCFNNYNLINNQCYALPFRCISLNSTGQCSKCSTGYQPIVQNGQSLCIYRVSNCIHYSRQGRCTECQVNYVLQNNLCNFFIVGCEQLVNYNNGTYCNKCLTGFYLRNGYCIRDPNCITVAEGGICTKCIDGYRLNPQTRLCVKNSIDNCLVQVNDTDCLQCQPGFVKITYYGRVYCILQRIVYSGCAVNQYPCPRCQAGFTLRDDGFCYATLCKNSLTAFSTRTCEQCYPYFKIDSTNRFCTLYNCNSPSCYNSTTPPPGFIQTNRTGFLIYINYCLTLEDDYSCAKCSNYRYPNLLVQWQLCYPHSCQNTSVLNCNGQCYNYFGNHLQNDSSVCLPDNCRVYAQDTTCVECVPPFVLSQGICLYLGPCINYSSANNKCLECKDAYRLVNGQCVAKNCTQYSPNDISRCLKCVQGFQLTTNNTCQLKYCVYPNKNYPCPECLKGYFFNEVTGVCHMRNCRQYSYSQQRCLQCDTYFSLKQDKYCIPDHCSNFDQNSWECKKCLTGYQLNENGFCVIRNCCVFNGPICLTCCNGFDFVSGVCRDRCDSYGANNVCIQCKQGYKLNSNNQCVMEISGCVIYQGSRCVDCEAGLKLVNGVCVPKYCKNFTQAIATSCIQCMPRFYRLSNGLCYPKNCQMFNSTAWQCIECTSTDYYQFDLISNESVCLTSKCSSYQVEDFVCRQCEKTSGNKGISYELQVINGSEVCLLKCSLYYEQTNNFTCQPKYCANFSSTATCLQCLPGYHLDPSTGLCQLQFCLTYDGEHCAICQNGFILDPLNNKYCVPRNCQNYTWGDSHCFDCLPGYVRQYDLCILSGCFKFNDQYVCQECFPGFRLVQTNGNFFCQKVFISDCRDGYYFSQTTGKCQPINIDYCRYVNPTAPTECLACFDGYFLWQGKCHSKEGCKLYQFSYISGCKSCIEGFKLQGQLCVKDLCRDYYSNGKCRTCIDNYFLWNGICTDYSPLCLKGNSNQGCIACQAGYQSINGLCYKLPDNCVSLSSKSVCQKCVQKYVLFNGLCFKQILRCLSQSGPFCNRCETGYTISQDRKLCIAKKSIRYCVQHDSTYEFCLLCADGYDLTPDKKCLATHCARYNLTTYQCLECRNYTKNQQGQSALVIYFLKDEKCIKVELPFCDVPLNLTHCKVCLQSYDLAGGVCRASNCQDYGDNKQQCRVCLAGFYLTAQYICKINPQNCKQANLYGECLNCSAEYELTSYGLCVKKIEFCQRYNVSGICMLCQSGFYLTADYLCRSLPTNCLEANLNGACLRCENGYVLASGGVCYRTVENCFSYNSVGACIECNQGYYLTVNKTCQILPNNCLQANLNGACIKCTAGFTIKNGQCVRVIENCQIIDQNINLCQKCAIGFYLIDGFCFKLPDGCRVPNKKKLCLQCLKGYILQNGLCYKAIDNCLTYNTRGWCVDCANEFYLNVNNTCSQNPPNCQKTTSNGVCLQCISGYLLQNGQCFIPVMNCLVYNSATNQCHQCEGGYFLISGQCYKLPPNCLTTNTQLTCLNCISGYQLQNGRCYLRLPYCQVYQSYGRCKNCTIGYYLTSSGTCTQYPQGCTEFSASQGCLTCIAGYVLQGGICYRESPNCFIYNQTTKSCSRCLDQFVLINGTCFRLPDNCVQLANNKQCSRCMVSYVLQTNGLCYKEIQYCLYYDGPESCANCVQGYYLNTRGTCTLNPNNCHVASRNGSCLQCIEGYLLKEGICYKFDPNCQRYNPSTLVCQSCVTGYYLTYQYVCSVLPNNCVSANLYGNCTACVANYSVNMGRCYPSIPGCSSYNVSNEMCTGCINGFFLRDGYCYRTVENCLVYSPSNYNCIKCVDGFLMSNNECITCGQGNYVDSYGVCRPNPPNCKSANQFGQCFACLNDYALVDGQCTKEILYCQKYNTSHNGDTVCLQCYTGFYLKNTTACLRLPAGCAQANSQGTCLRCFEGYSLNGNGICYMVVPYCQSYQLSTGVCLQCIKNYYLDVNHTCQPLLEDNCLFANSLGQCIQCVQGYVLINGICYGEIPYCLQHSASSYKCLQCFAGYYLSNRTCTKLPNGCSDVRNGLCIECLQGYRLVDGGLCQFIDNQTCIKYQLLSGQCLECRAGFYLDQNNNCRRLPDYCFQANSQGSCINCISDYILSNGFCYKEISFCAQMGQQGNCLQCISQYYLRNNLCYPYPSYCSQFDSSTYSCAACVAGYQLVNGVCTISTPTSCLFSSSGRCITCINSFYERWVNEQTGQVISSHTSVSQYCQPYPTLCSNVDLFGNCISCCYGSTLQNGKCIPNQKRAQNCDVFDSNQMKCIRCVSGYSYCGQLGICIGNSDRCLSYAANGKCLECQTSLKLVNGECIRRPPGETSSSTQVCNSGYQFISSSNEYGNGGCFRNKNDLRKVSTMAGTTYHYTNYSPSAGLNNQQQPSTTIWNPPSFLNNYISVQFNTPQVIHYLQTQGTSQGWVTEYLVQFRNQPDSPFICWNSCQNIKGNSDGTTVSQLRLAYPIVASEVRLYPLKWNRAIWLSLDMLVEVQ